MVLPLVVLIHCYGCEAWMEINKYAAAADRLQFVLVAPEGIERSFNSPSCCGAARESNIDDVAFVENIVEDLFLAQSRPASGAHPLHGGHIHISRQAIFAAGFSNGGFFVSHLASMSHGVAWAGIAAAAGHEYTPRRTEALAVAMQHCVHDRHVSINGCCASNRCCCGIEAPNCVTTEAIFRRWVEVNRCSNGTRLVRPRTSGMTDARCWLGIGCEAETSSACGVASVHTRSGATISVASPTTSLNPLAVRRAAGMAARRCLTRTACRWCAFTSLMECKERPPICVAAVRAVRAHIACVIAGFTAGSEQAHGVDAPADDSVLTQGDSMYV